MGIINSDEFATVSAENGGSELKSYETEVNGIATTLRLTDADAERRGLKASAPKQKQKAAPANKAATVSDKRAAVTSKSFGQGKKGDA